MVQSIFRHLKLFRRNSQVSQTDRQTDRHGQQCHQSPLLRAPCLWAPIYGLTLWCALGLLVEDAIQVPQLQFMTLRTLSHLSMHLRWKICWHGSSRMRCLLTNSDIHTTHDVCVTAPSLSSLDCFTALSCDSRLAADVVNWNEARRSMSALHMPFGLDSLSCRARPSSA